MFDPETAVMCPFLHSIILEAINKQECSHIQFVAECCLTIAVTVKSLRPAAEKRAINNVVANAMAEAFNPRSSAALRSAADGVLKVCTFQNYPGRAV